jgi:transposase
MLDQESLVDIHVLHQQDNSIRSISRQLGISRNTVRSYLRDFAKLPNYGPRAARPSKLIRRTHLREGVRDNPLVLHRIMAAR